jgi:Rieske Fe-S protein
MVVSAALVATGALGVEALLTRLADAGSPGQTTIQVSETGTGTAPQGYVFVAPLSALSGRTSAYFNHPTLGSSILVSVGGQWKAFSAICTHQVCTVRFGGGSSLDCPCHGATFSTSDGAVLGGPAPRPLPEMGVLEQGGNLYVSQTRIN